MKKQIYALFLSIALIAINQLAIGVTAYPYPVEITQPDGTKITITLKGDEHVKWAVTTDGYSILRNSKGIYEYAIRTSNDDMVPSGIPVKDQSERSSSDVQFLNKTARGLTYSRSQVELMRSISGMNETGQEKAFPTTGSRKLVCILIGFTDAGFSKTKADLENLFNQVGYNIDGATGSVYDYYKENSYNKLDLSVTVAGPYTAANNMAYYGANINENDIRPRELITEAVNLANPAVNYADFDNDNDGTVDGVYVIYAGYGEENTGVSANAIWAHAWSITPVTLDGKIISRYSCSSELRGSSGTGLTRIGVICHEFGHVMGASDYYDTDYTTNGSYSGTGNWDLMAGGSWNNSGVTPAHHNPYTKIYSLNWATATTLTSITNISINLNDAEQYSNSFYRVNTAKLNEYFLVENRQQHKFDTNIPGHGMIIYHVDGDYISNAGNQINAGSHQGMYPVCASATGNPPTTYGTINSGGLPFPGTTLKTSFTDATTPYSKCWAGANTNKPITNIAENTAAKTVSFSFVVNSTAPSAITVSASEISPGSAIINALVSASNALTTITFEYGKTISYGSVINGTPNTVTGENLTEISAVLTGLTAGTTYNYRVKAVNSYGTTYGSNMTFNTLAFPKPDNLTATILNPDLGVVKLNWNYSGPVFEDFEDGVADNFVFYDNRTFVENGVLNAYGIGNNTWSEAYYNKDFQNFTLEYKVKRNQGDPLAAIGMFFRSTGLRNTSNINGYGLSISSNGSYSVWKYTAGVATALIPWTSSSAINKVTDAWNFITIEANGSNIKFYINSQYVNAINDATYTSGRFNFAAYLNSGFTHKVCWDDISIIPQSGVLKSTPSQVTAINTPLDVSSSPERAPENLSDNKAVEVKGMIDKSEVSKMTFRYFRLYQNGSILDTTSLTSYSSSLQNFGTYEYKVSAVYDEGESQPSGPVSIRWYGNPMISVNPVSFDETLLSGDSLSRNMTIKNNGSGLLIINIPKIAAGSGIFEDFEDGTADNFVFYDSRTFVANGVLNASGSGNDTWAETYYNKDFQNFTLEYKVKRNQGDPLASIGTFFRSTGLRNTSNLNGYGFNISSNGSYSVWKYTAGVSSSLIPWTSSSAINTVTDAWNIITIEANGSNVKFYINSQYVNTITDATYTSGRFDFGAYLSSGYTHKVCWDDISIIPQSGIIKSASELVAAINTPLSGSGSPEKAPENLSNNKSIEVKGLIEKANAWINTSLVTDTLSAGESVIVELEFNAKDLVAADYNTILLINSTDVNNPQFKVQCSLHVLGKPKANFSANSTQVLPGVELQFTDNSTGVPTSWLWRFPSGSPSTSSEKNPKVVYTSIGTYDVTLIVTNSYGRDSTTKVRYITVANIQYCTSNLGGSGSCPGDISLVSIAGTSLNNTNHNLCSTINSSTYASYPASGATTGTLQKGNTYQLSVTTVSSDIVSVWIDFNHNSVFDTNEWTQVSTATTANVASTKTITVPTTAMDGSTTMRIRSRAVGNTNGAGDACTRFSSGITEDYTISIGLPFPPTVTTATISSMTLTTATCGGTITSDGNAAVTVRGVCWSTTANPTISLATKTTDGAGVGTFTSNITGLTPGITYHVRAYATNSAGTGYGSEIQFTTCSAVVIPTVTTTAASAITSATATSGGIVTSGGCAPITSRGVCWSTTANPTIALNTKTTNGFGEGTFTSNISGLTGGTTYHVRAYATNSAGTGYGADLSFTCLLNAPFAYSAMNILQTSFTANWKSSISAAGYYLDVSTSSSFTTFISGYNSKDVGNLTSISVTGLSANSSYYYRLRAYGSGGISANSNIIQTITLPDPPSAPIANPATNILQTSFTANWSGSAMATGYLLDVSTNSAFTVFITGFNGRDLGNNTSTGISGLVPNTPYYYRIRAYNSGGSSQNSGTILVTTLPIPPLAPLAKSAKNIAQTSFTANWVSSATATGYMLDVSTNSGFTTFLSGYNNKDIGNLTSTSVTGLISKTIYYYRVRSYNTGGTSVSSNSIVVTTLTIPPVSPTGLSSSSCNNLVTLKWNKNTDPYVSIYRIYAGTTTNSLSVIDSTIAGNVDITKIISGLKSKQTYYFRVKAVNYDGPESPFSTESITTVKTGVIPKIRAKWGDIMICSNYGDSITSYQWYMGGSTISNATGQYYVTNKIPGVYQVKTIDKNGCQNSSNTISSSGTKSLSVYPNPASVSFSLKLPDEQEGEAIVSIINSSGIKVKEFITKSLDDEFLKEISVAGFDEGIYIVHVLINRKDLYSTKIVVVK